MELNRTKDGVKLRRARKRMEELKGFYWHLASYIGVNSFITISKIGRNIRNGENLMEAIWDSSTFYVWFFWGIGLAFHAMKVFSLNPIFGKDWEERQIQKFMEEEKREIEKYR